MYRLVIVDDEYIVVEGIKAVLSRIGISYEIVGTASDGKEGLATILRTSPDLVITDIRIPYMDGLSMIEACKESLPDTAFIIISGYQEFEYARRALLLGALDYIDKPVTIDKLRNALARVEVKSKDPHAAALDVPEPDVPAAETAAAGDVPGALEASHDAISQILSYMHKNYAKDIGLTEMADIVGMNPAYLSVLFKENMGISFIKYLTRFRVEKAKQMLQSGMKPTAVATAVGYNDPHYFYEIFKKNTGMTPTEFRASAE